MVAVPIRRPFLEHAPSRPLLMCEQRDLFRHVGQAEATHCRVDDVVGVVEDKLAVDADFDFPPFLLELPMPNPPLVAWRSAMQLCPMRSCGCDGAVVFLK